MSLSYSLFAFVGLALICVSGIATPKYVTLEEVKPVKIKAGKSGDAVVKVKVEPPFHLQANPPTHPVLKATILTVAGEQGIEAGKPVYPPGQPYRLKGAQRSLSTYFGKIEIRLPLHATSKAKPGKIQLQGSLSFQACNDKICLFPTSVPVPVPVVVSK